MRRSAPGSRQRPGRDSTGVLRGATPVIDIGVAVGDVFREEAGRLTAWLAELLSKLFPAHAEVLGLLVLMRLHLARAEARFDAAGELVLLRDQDRARWDRAAIAACHAELPSWAATDWPQILILYDMLLRLEPSPVTQLNRTVALSHVLGPESALAAVERLAAALSGYHLWHAVRAALLRALGRDLEARPSERRALELTHNPAEQSLLRRRLSSQC